MGRPPLHVGRKLTTGLFSRNETMKIIVKAGIKAETRITRLKTLLWENLKDFGTFEGNTVPEVEDAGPPSSE